MIRKSHGVAFAALALAATGAYAQSTVNIYGILDVGYGSFSTFTLDSSGNLATKHQTAVQNGLYDASFLGFRGSEDLGGGTKAIFSLETYLDATTGQASGGGDTGGTSLYGSQTTGSSANFWGRNTWVGLDGGFGRVTLGHTDSLAYQAVTSFNAFQSSDYFGTARLLFDNGGGTLGDTVGLGLDQGWSKAITYYSTDYSGFNFGVQYAPKGSASNEGANWALDGNYSNGGLGLNLTYEELKRPFAAGASSKDKLWSLNGSYDFTVVKVYAQWAQTKIDTPSNNTKAKFWNIGVSAPVGPGTILAAFQQRKDTDSLPGSGQVRDFSLGYEYNLSKRTFVYGGFINERAKSSNGFFTGGTNSSTKSGNSLAVGVHHTF